VLWESKSRMTVEDKAIVLVMTKKAEPVRGIRSRPA
jgi:hypothetical protein